MCVHVHQRYGVFLDPNILLEKTPIIVVKEVKFLGLIFDTKLTLKNHLHILLNLFLNHVQYLKSSYQKALDILRVVGHTTHSCSVLLSISLPRALSFCT